MTKHKKQQPYDPAAAYRGKGEGFTMADPTKERSRKAPFGWETTSHAGGQRSHQARTVLDENKEQFTESEWTTLQEFCKLAESCDVRGVICGRAYTGMPYTGGTGDKTDKQQAAQAKFVFVLEKLQGIDLARAEKGEKRALGFTAVALTLVLGVLSEAQGKPKTLADVGLAASKWVYEPAAKGVGFGLLRGTAWALRYALAAADRTTRSSERTARANQQAYEHGYQVGAREAREKQAELEAKRQRAFAQVESHFKKTKREAVLA